MILDKEVITGIGGRNMNHFEKLGYKIPRRIDKRGRLKYVKGIKILVKIEDLPHTSQVKVRIKCEDCGIERKVDYGTLHARKNSSYNKNGETLCSTCANHRMSGENNAKYIHGNNLYCTYRFNAGRRNFKFELSIEEFEMLIPSTCFYCRNDSNGIDRWNNNLGYVFSNCVPCCKICNFLKNNVAPDVFITRIKDMYNTLKLKGLIHD